MSQQVSQEKLQQQLSLARAASKASDSGRVQAEAQHQAQLADLHQQLNSAQQRNTNLEMQHQQDLQQQLASAAAAATDAHRQEMKTLKDQYTACCHQYNVAVERLDQEVALLVQEAEHNMATVAQEMSALLGASCSSQAELQQQLQQLRVEVTEVYQGRTGTAMGESVGSPPELQEALIGMRQQLDGVGFADVGALLDEHQRLKTQVMRCNNIPQVPWRPCLVACLTHKHAASQTPDPLPHSLTDEGRVPAFLKG